MTQLISPLYCSHRKAVILSVSGKRICLNDHDYSCSVTLILCKDYSFESRSRVYAKYAIIRPELYDNPDQKNRSAYNFYWAFTSHLTLYLCGLTNIRISHAVSCAHHTFDECQCSGFKRTLNLARKRNSLIVSDTCCETKLLGIWHWCFGKLFHLASDR